jgi:hypothetical protein
MEFLCLQAANKKSKAVTKATAMKGDNSKPYITELKISLYL